MATKKPAKQADPLDQLAALGADLSPGAQRVIALLLWQDRMRNPDMFRQLTEHDIKGLDDCTRYLKVKPVVRVHRPEGVPAQPAIPASGNRRAVPARPAIPPRSYVMVCLVDERGDAIKPIENNEQDFDAATAAQQVQRARTSAPELAQRIVAQARTGEVSLSDMTDAANALLILARSA